MAKTLEISFPKQLVLPVIKKSKLVNRNIRVAVEQRQQFIFNFTVRIYALQR
jgi:hypothetical protein